MCVVIDINRLASVFNLGSADHADFAPLRKWVISGPGFMVFGGTKYLEELGERYKRLFVEHNKSRYGSFIVLRISLVDQKHRELCNSFPDLFDFGDPHDDSHIIAICKVSGTRIVCTNDKKCKEAIKSKSIFTKNRPRLYSSDKNADLLKPDNVIRISQGKIKK